jgi:uncharacterized phage protein (TIGR01671 family)
MREVKFRRALFLDGKFSHFKYWGKNIGHATFVSPGSADAYDAKDDQQFIGLPDKNGKEIYEGDIVRVPELYETPEMTATTYVNWEVVFLFGSWHLKKPDYTPELGSTTLYDEYHSYDEDFEVIGNIYENPELLEKEAHP